MDRGLRFWFGRLILLAVLAIITVGFFTFFERYEPIGRELLLDPGFGEGLTYWTQSGRGVVRLVDGAVVLQADAPSADVAIRQTLFNAHRYRLLRLAGELRATNIRSGERFFHKGRLALVMLDENRRMLPGPHVAVDLVGTRPWTEYQKVFKVPGAAQEVQVRVSLIGATGELAIRRLSLTEVRERDAYLLLRNVGMVAWTAVLIGLALPFLPRLRWDLPHLLICLLVAGIFIGTLMPVDFKIGMENEVDAALKHLLAEEEGVWQAGSEALASGFVDKLGHVLFFALLAFAVRWGYPHRPRLHLFLGLLILASISEVLQFFVEGRLPRVTDFLLDGAGLLIGLGAYELMWGSSRLLKRRRKDDVRPSR